VLHLLESDKKRILIIDDDPDITITVSEVLEQNGFKLILIMTLY
jgi:DNA-binding response OmpR family regulator